MPAQPEKADKPDVSEGNAITNTRTIDSAPIAISLPSVCCQMSGEAGAQVPPEFICPDAHMNVL